MKVKLGFAGFDPRARNRRRPQSTEVVKAAAQAGVPEMEQAKVASVAVSRLWQF